jgi:hypothetical protein
MDRPAPLPLPLEALPEALRRFCDPASPGPMRAMAAKGLVPVKGGDLVTLLCQLGADSDAAIAKAARESLAKVPEEVLLGACAAPLHPAVLDDLAERRGDSYAVLERIVANPATADGTLCWLAQRCDERLGERIATNESRMLAAPAIIGALYTNKNVRMSTADRLIELASRHGVVVPGIPAATLEAHAEALRGELVFEASDAPLPDDVEFQDALAADDDDVEAVVRDPDDDSEKIKEKHLPLATQIARMSKAKKIRLATVGNASARALLVRDRDRQVAMSAIHSPGMQVSEVAAIAQSRQVSSDVLGVIGKKREWLAVHEVKRALVFNPKTPLNIALTFVAHLHDSDLRTLSRSRNVPPPIKSAALQRLTKKSS